MNAIDAYAAAVVDGLVPAGKYHRLACARHQRDRAREGTPDFPYRFDLPKAERFFRFAGKLKHYKGEWAGQPIELQPYQLFRLGSIFGWVHVVTGLRRFRTSYHEIPRKNGKSLEAAVVALYLTFFDGEAGAEGYTIATKRDQARIVWGDARQLVLSSGLKTRIDVQVANLHVDATASKLEPLGADHDSTDGLNPSLIIVDEFHAHKTRRPHRRHRDGHRVTRRQPHTFTSDRRRRPGQPWRRPASATPAKCSRASWSTRATSASSATTDEDDWRDWPPWRRRTRTMACACNPRTSGPGDEGDVVPGRHRQLHAEASQRLGECDAPWMRSMAGAMACGDASLSDEDCYVSGPVGSAWTLRETRDICAMITLFPPSRIRPLLPSPVHLARRTWWSGLTGSRSLRRLGGSGWLTVPRPTSRDLPAGSGRIVQPRADVSDAGGGLRSLAPRPRWRAAGGGSWARSQVVSVPQNLATMNPSMPRLGGTRVEGKLRHAADALSSPGWCPTR